MPTKLEENSEKSTTLRRKSTRDRNAPPPSPINRRIRIEQQRSTRHPSQLLKTPDDSIHMRPIVPKVSNEDYENSSEVVRLNSCHQFAF